MKLIAPDYYSDFACIKGDCRHSCCIGWEIDIDDDTMDTYRGIRGEIGRRLADNIDENDGSAHFRLTPEERCPFLNGEGLCDLILELGEDCLCQICDDHPRFRNFFSDREEIGLGLCCEAAGRLILQRNEAASWIVLDDDGEDEELFEDEEALLKLRSRLTAIVQDRSMTVDARVLCIADAAGIPKAVLNPGNRAEFLLGLERLDEEWSKRLDALQHCSSIPTLPHSENFELALEQLLVYLLWRHLPAALDDDDLSGHVAFVLYIWQLVRDLCAFASSVSGAYDPETMVELARLASSEIEYSDENIGAIITELHRICPEL